MEELQKKPFDQFRRPSGVLGRAVVISMNRRHYRVTGWGLARATFRPDSRMLDLGCGGGRTMARLLKLAPRGSVVGVDHSPDCVRWASERNRTSVARGRARVVQADVASLPFADAAFDLAAAVETVYFWPDPAASFREILRVLRPGGQLIVVNEVYADASTAERDREMERRGHMHVFAPDELQKLLRQAGFAVVSAVTDPSHNWLCCRALKAGETAQGR